MGNSNTDSTEVILKKIQRPKDSQSRVSCWGWQGARSYHWPHLELAMEPGWRPALLADLPEAEVRFLLA